MKRSVWYVGGKSAGHIMPLLTLAAQQGLPAVIITTHRALDKKIVHESRSHCIHQPLYIPDIHRKKIWLFAWHAVLWVYAWVQLAILFFKTRPEKIISTGGLCAVPVFLFAQLFGIPCELFELNAVPGHAVMFLARLSRRIFYCYTTGVPHVKHPALQYKPYPVRDFLVTDSLSARIRLSLDPTKKTVCFLGGSQGSQFINQFALKLAARFLPDDVQIIHQTGLSDYASLSSWYYQRGYRAYLVDYYAEIELLYSAADAVVCRAGAGTLWELERLALKTCIIPLETPATDHQLHNAQALCAYKPQQFFMVTQAQAAVQLEQIISFLELRS